MPRRLRTPSAGVYERIVAGQSVGQGYYVARVVIQDAMVEVVAAWRICASVSACRKCARVSMQRGWIITLISLGSILGAIVNRYGYGGDLNGEDGRLGSTQSHPPPALARAHSSQFTASWCSSDRAVAPCNRKFHSSRAPAPRSHHCRCLGLWLLNLPLTPRVLGSPQCKFSPGPLAPARGTLLIFRKLGRALPVALTSHVL